MTREDYRQLHFMYKEAAGFFAKIPSYISGGIGSSIGSIGSGIKGAAKYAVKNPGTAFTAAGVTGILGYSGSKVYRGVKSGVQNVPHLPPP